MVICFCSRYLHQHPGSCLAEVWQMTLHRQTMLHSSELNEDSAQYSCNLGKCTLYSKDGNSNSNHLLMQLTMFTVDSCSCVLNKWMADKNDCFWTSMKMLSCYRAGQSQWLCLTKRSLWSSALFPLRGSGDTHTWLFCRLGLGRMWLDHGRGGWEVGFQTNCPERGRVIKWEGRVKWGQQQWKDPS